ncbi:MAG: hypothetical protein INR65_00700 [Gluconacetobacter diazotrophicus]|nr:hypothetical protein [Gluconacetobacter diazotrophicus]
MLATVASVGCLPIAVPAGTARAASPDAFLVRSTADLVDICQPGLRSGPQSGLGDDAAAAGLAFCQGFVVGAYRVIEEVAAARPSARFFCMPSLPPTRTDAIDAFVAWARARPGQMNRVPAESIGSFLAETYPCGAGGRP